jgi:hypothetical protein
MPYFESMPVQTNFMASKQVMKVVKEYSKHIVSMGESPTVVIDDNFYETTMGENSTGSAFPVNVFAMRVEWILNKP